MAKTITDIEGVYANSLAAGIKEEGKDLVFFFVPDAGAAAGVYTKNAFCAPCVAHTRDVIASGDCKAVIVNSGNANAVTGATGVENVKRTAKQAAELLKLSADQVAIASTGIIGKQLPMDKLEAGLQSLLVNPEVKDGEAAAEGILTTDTCTKHSFLEDGRWQVAGVAKGSGMIAPNMATMFGFLFTNVAVPQACFQRLLSSAADKTFNMISVDTDTSTSDMVLALSTGAEPFDESDPAQVERFEQLLFNASKDLALQIVRDGEGASRLIEVRVNGAASEQDARAVARSISDSPLVKTAVHGADPNWGRIVMAVGKVEGAAVDPDRVDVLFQDTAVLSAGAPCEVDREALAAKMKVSTVYIDVNLHLGKEEATAWGCDLTKGYIDINTCYN